MGTDQPNHSADHLFPVHGMDAQGIQQPPLFNFHTFANDHVWSQANYPHRHSFYQVLYIIKGGGYHVVDFQSLPVTPPVIFFVSPDQVHFWQLDVPLEGYGLLFSPDFLVLNAIDIAGFDKLALFHSLAHSPLLLNQRQSVALLGIIEALVHEFESRELNYMSVVSAYLHILLSKIQRFYSEVEPTVSLNPTAELVRRFRQLVSQHYRTERTVVFYADQMGMDADHLSEKIRYVTGHTASQIIRQEIILEAKRLLVNTNMTIQQISYHLAFNDPAYFGRFFKRETAFTPGQFRDEMCQKYQIDRV